MKNILMCLVLFVQLILLGSNIANLFYIELGLALLNCTINVVVDDD